MYDQGLKCHGYLKKRSTLVGKTQLARCLKELVSGPLCCDISNKRRGAKNHLRHCVYIRDTVYLHV